MSDAKHKKIKRHTPSLSGEKGYRLAYEGEDTVIAVVYDYDALEFLQNACNSHDDLLEVLKVLETVVNEEWIQGSHLERVAREAIAKAQPKKEPTANKPKGRPWIYWGTARRNG